MINWHKSSELNDCTVENLKDRFARFPRSNKQVITNCDKCGNERKIYYHVYAVLCRSIAQKVKAFMNTPQGNVIKYD